MSRWPGPAPTHEVARAFPDGLNHQRDGSGDGVGISDRQRDAFGSFGVVNDDKLARLANLAIRGA